MRRVVLAAALFLATLVFLYFALPRGIGEIDLLEYWSATTLFIKGQNPYDAQALHALQAPFLAERIAIIMWNPPALLALLFPIALIPFRLLVPLWLLLSAAAYVMTIRAAKELIGACTHEARNRTVENAFLITFYPAALCIFYGQLALFLGAAYALSLCWLVRANKSGDTADAFTAGALFSLTTLKPHLLYLSYLYLLIRVVRGSERTAAIGFTIFTVVLAVLPLFFQSAIYSHYASLSATPPIYWKTPTLGSWLQELSGHNSVLVRFLPTLIVGFGSLPWLWRRAAPNSPLIPMLAVLCPLSLLTSPYGWLYDCSLLIPTVLLALASSQKRRALTAAVLIVANLMVGSPLLPSGIEYAVWYPALIFIVSFSQISITKHSTT